jgi:hypothetical protein
MIGIADFSRIWCPNCSSVRPRVIDIMGPDHLNKYSAVDLICGNCRFVIATLHEESHAETEALRTAQSRKDSRPPID